MILGQETDKERERERAAAAGNSVDAPESE
jgi:hypothetical protein